MTLNSQNCELENTSDGVVPEEVLRAMMRTHGDIHLIFPADFKGYLLPGESVVVATAGTLRRLAA